MTQTLRQSSTFEDRLNAAESAAKGAQTVITDTGTTVSIQKKHMGALLICNNGSATAATLPSDSTDPSINIGEWVDIYMLGAGQVTVTAGAGVTLRKAAATAKILAQYGKVRATKIAANTWSVNGELAAA